MDDSRSFGARFERYIQESVEQFLLVETGNQPAIKCISEKEYSGKFQMTFYYHSPSMPRIVMEVKALERVKLEGAGSGEVKTTS